MMVKQSDVQMALAHQAGVVGLYVAHSEGEAMVGVDVVQAVSRRGLVGDRYYHGTGYYSNKKGWGANVTLIQHEAIAAVNTGHQTDFTAAMLRRNIVTSQVDLHALLGREFQCGSAVLRGTKRFPPCARLAYLTGRREVIQYFIYACGIGAEVIADGEIRLGDSIEIVG